MKPFAACGLLNIWRIRSFMSITATASVALKESSYGYGVKTLYPYIKIAGRWVFIPLKKVSKGIDP